MKFEPRTILTSVSSVQFATGLHRDVIHDRATGSSLFDGYRFVWNVAADLNGDIPCLRFWSREIIFPASVRSLGFEQALKAILPPARKSYHTGEVENTLLSISGPLLMELRPELNGKLAANSSFFPREGLENFLRRRWLGCSRTATTGRPA